MRRPSEQQTTADQIDDHHHDDHFDDQQHDSYRLASGRERAGAPPALSRLRVNFVEPRKAVIL
jgi:hypothetical protein